MQQKLFLLPGFGENEKCFRNLKPFLKEFNLVDVDYRRSLEQMKLWETNPQKLAELLINQYKIKPTDKLVGHSMGGYFAHNVSILQGNSICLINSFTDTDKIVRFTNSQFINHFVTGTGLLKTSFMRNYIQSRNKDIRMRKEMLMVQKNFKSFTNDAMLKMSILSFGADLPPANILPLHLHALDDRVVRKPDHDFIKVRGGHFSAVFHPDEVYEKMESWLNLG